MPETPCLNSRLCGSSRHSDTFSVFDFSYCHLWVLMCQLARLMFPETNILRESFLTITAFHGVWLVESSVPNHNILNIVIKTHDRENWFGFYLGQGWEGWQLYPGTCLRSLGVWAQVAWPCPGLFAQGREIWVTVCGIDLNLLWKTRVESIICVSYFLGDSPQPPDHFSTAGYIFKGKEL